MDRCFFCNKYFIGQFKNLDRTNTLVIYRGTTVHSHTEMRDKNSNTHKHYTHALTHTLTHTHPHDGLLTFSASCLFQSSVKHTHHHHHHQRFQVKSKQKIHSIICCTICNSYIYFPLPKNIFLHPKIFF